MNDNKITPFYICIKDLTEEQVRSLFDACVEAGAHEYENMNKYSNGWGNYFFGVDFDLETVFYSSPPFYSSSSLAAKGCHTLEEAYAHIGMPCTPCDDKTITSPEAPESQNKIIKEETNTVTPLPCLNGVKIDLRDSEGNVDSVLSAKFQLACFEQGISWYFTKEISLKHLDSPFLYVDEDGISQDNHAKCFQNHPSKEIVFSPDNIQFTIEEVTPPKETININGVDYYKEDVDKMLSGVVPVGEE